MIMVSPDFRWAINYRDPHYGEPNIGQHLYEEGFEFYMNLCFKTEYWRELWIYNPNNDYWSHSHSNWTICIWDVHGNKLTDYRYKLNEDQRIYSIID